MLTLLDLKKIEAGIGFELIEEALVACPEMSVIPAETISGREMSLTVRTDLPTVGFRNINEGRARSKSKYATKVFQTGILDAQVAVDIAAIENLAGAARARTLEAEMVGHLQSAFLHVSKQTWQGTGNDAKGFPGIAAQMAADTDHEVDAGGSTATTDVYMLRIQRTGVQYLFGSGQTITMDEGWNKETVLDGSNNPYQALVNWVRGSIGLRLANKHAVVRIKNIGTDTGKGLTDALLSDAYEKFTAFQQGEPTHIFTTGRSIRQLQTSRTATNATGAPVPWPTSWEGIPIIRTAGIPTA